MTSLHKWLCILWIATILQSTYVDGFTTNPSFTKLQRCVYNKAHNMYGANCSDLNLHTVPNTLDTSIEILDLSLNRIKYLKNVTFIPYRNVKFLYLEDNKLTSIEVLAFEPLTSLEVLDLSSNSLHTIPSTILNLPLLRTLYIADNNLSNFNQDIDEMEKPFKAPLKFLSMVKCGLNEFPNFGMLPDLKYLNVSYNEFRNLSAKDFAELCGLETVDLTGSYYPHDDVCLNKPLAMWFIQNKIAMIPEVYSVFNPESEDIKDCSDIPLDDEDQASYNECMLRIQVMKKQKKAKQTWITIAGCLTGFLILATAFLCFMHRRNAKNVKKYVAPNNECENQNMINNKTKVGIIYRAVP